MVRRFESCVSECRHAALLRASRSITWACALASTARRMANANAAAIVDCPLALLPDATRETAGTGPMSCVGRVCRPDASAGVAVECVVGREARWPLAFVGNNGDGFNQAAFRLLSSTSVNRNRSCGTWRIGVGNPPRWMTLIRPNGCPDSFPIVSPDHRIKSRNRQKGKPQNAHAFWHTRGSFRRPAKRGHRGRGPTNREGSRTAKSSSQRPPALLRPCGCS